jgi:hypothetical protein
MLSKLEKLIFFLIAYGIIMKVLWSHLTESTQVNEVLLVLFAVSIIIFTMIFEMHKISEDEDSNKENENRR